MRTAYDAYAPLVAPARPSSHPLRLIAGAGLTVLLFIALGFAYAALVPVLVGYEAGTAKSAVGQPAGVVLLLFQFVCLVLALSIALRLVHRRGLAGLIGPFRRAAAQFLRCTLLLLPLYLLLFVVPVPDEYAPDPNMTATAWLSWLPLALPAIMVQITAEELAFRGYLQSQLAARFRHPLVWIGLPAALFGVVHLDPAIAGENAWVLAVWATLFGAAAADLTARSGSLGPALSLHFTNNVFAILVTAPEGSLDGLALYTIPLDLAAEGLAWYVLPVEALFTLCAWLAARLALRV
ncbi:CPBP family glutamic-type intramembrane protease [Roseovarius salis]|uniref:CPBP family intramembrane glutamic endopeptidase n=1 Tax=Roseovarius salis TaxID=3376063 RepID=UPI0037C75863